jgi:predicted nucleic acid-binding protein
MMSRAPQVRTPSVSRTTCAVRRADELSTSSLAGFSDFLWTWLDVCLLGRDLTRKGKTLSLADTTIAAVALAYGCTLVTENEKDFPIPQLQLHVP